MSENKRKTIQSFPPLATVCKKRFPFTLACPSFVYPAGYLDNVRHLAPFVDEIELLFFESRFRDSLPSAALIRDLVQQARSGQITYNVHLPTDIYLGHRDAGVRQTAVDVLRQLIDRCAPLNPTTFTLHLIRDPSEPDHRRWQANSAASLEAVLATGVPSRRIGVENLDDDIEQVAPVIEDLDLSVCMDMGHLMAHEVDMTSFFRPLERTDQRCPPARGGWRAGPFAAEPAVAGAHGKGDGCIETIQRRGFPRGLFSPGAECLDGAPA